MQLINPVKHYMVGLKDINIYYQGALHCWHVLQLINQTLFVLHLVL